MSAVAALSPSPAGLSGIPTPPAEVLLSFEDVAIHLGGREIVSDRKSTRLNSSH